MFNFNLKDLPFTVLNLVAMPIRWMKKGFENPLDEERIQKYERQPTSQGHVGYSPSYRT